MTPSEPQRRPVWCGEHHELSWLYSDGSLGCWYCLTVETSCHCTPGEPIVTRREAQAIPPSEARLRAALLLLHEWREASLNDDASALGTLTDATTDFIERTAATPSGGTLIDVEMLAQAIPEDAVIPYSDWSREGLARTIIARLSESSPAEEGAQ